MTTETPTLPNVTGEILEAFLSNAKALNWSQDQLETLAATWMKQAHTMRHDGEKVFEVLVSQAKVHSEEMARLAEQTVANATQHVPGWDLMTVGTLRRQVEDLAARVDSLSRP
jgi:hemerythrin